MVIDFIRHGEPVGGACYRGNSIDDPLSDTGWQQMRKAIGDANPWNGIVSSPMLRCRAFAEEVAERHGLPVSVDNDLREIGFGDWVGKTKAELLAERPEEFQRFYDDPVRNTPVNAEPVEQFLARIDRCIHAIQSKFIDQHLLVVAHAGVIRASIAAAIQAPAASMYRLSVRNAGITRIEYTERRSTLIFHDGRL